MLIYLCFLFNFSTLFFVVFYFFFYFKSAGPKKIEKKCQNEKKKLNQKHY